MNALNMYVFADQMTGIRQPALGVALAVLLPCVSVVVIPCRISSSIN